MHVYLIGFSPRFRQGRLVRCQLRRAQRLHLLHLLKRGPDQYRIGGTCRKDMRLRQQSAAARQVPIHLGQKWGSGYRRTTEDIHKGYIEMPSTPLFAFGHLSRYEDIRLSENTSLFFK